MGNGHDRKRRDNEPCDNRELALLTAYGALEAERRDGLLARVHERKSGADMADWNGLRSLLGTHVGIGVHGFSHLPLTMIDDPEQDILQARELVRSNLGPASVISMSFPMAGMMRKFWRRRVP